MPIEMKNIFESFICPSIESYDLVRAFDKKIIHSIPLAGLLSHYSGRLVIKTCIF